MSVITITAQVTEKNTRKANTKNGEVLILSAPLFGKEKGSSVKVPYGSAFLPAFIKIGDIVTVTGRVEAKESGEFVNYNFVFPTVEKAFVEGGQSYTSTPDADLFEGSPMEVSDEDLPF